MSIALAVVEENIVEIEVLAADSATTVEDVLAVIVDQLTTSAAVIAMIYPTQHRPLNLYAVPDTGAWLVALPAPVRGMGSFPLRAVAWTDHGGVGI